MLLALLILAAAPVTIDPGVGHVHFAVSTQNAEARRYVDQGMAYLYGFNHETAIRSFQKAGELDPNLAMAWWGMALALGPNINLDGQYAEAEKVFKADLKRNPGNPRSLFGLAEAQRKQKKSPATAMAEFKKSWRGGALRIEDL